MRRHPRERHPAFAYRLLREERRPVSVADLARADALEFLGLAARLPLHVQTTVHPRARADDALADLRAGPPQGAAVLAT